MPKHTDYIYNTRRQHVQQTHYIYTTHSPLPPQYPPPPQTQYTSPSPISHAPSSKPPQHSKFPLPSPNPPLYQTSQPPISKSPPLTLHFISKKPLALKKNINEKLKIFHKCFCAFLISRRGRFVLRNFFFFDDDGGNVRLAREQSEREIRIGGMYVL